MNQTSHEGAPTLEAHAISKRFRDRKVVDGVSIEVGQGEIVGLLGPNGAGKTTTFQMVMGMILPDGGAISLRGRDITRLPMHKRAALGVGYLHQEPSVFRKLTVEDNVVAALEGLPVSVADRKLRAAELLAELEISHLAACFAYTLSGGERRRVEIARALVTSPSFLLLDEPFTGVDPISVLGLHTVILRLKSMGLGLLVTDHNVHETLPITDRSYIIHGGRIEDFGTPEELAASGKARKVYLGDRFSLEREV